MIRIFTLKLISYIQHTIYQKIYRKLSMSTKDAEKYVLKTIWKFYRLMQQKAK